MMIFFVCKVIFIVRRFVLLLLCLECAVHRERATTLSQQSYLQLVQFGGTSKIHRQAKMSSNRAAQHTIKRTVAKRPPSSYSVGETVLVC